MSPTKFSWRAWLWHTWCKNKKLWPRLNYRLLPSLVTYLKKAGKDVVQGIEHARERASIMVYECP